MKNTDTVNEEVNKLKQEKAAFQAQSRLLENFVSLAQSPGKETTLNAILQQTLEISAQITGAEKGSLFLLDSNEIVTDSILTRGKTSSRKRTKIIGKILRKGLARVSKVVMWTVPLPILCLVILFIRGVTLPGAVDGLAYYLTPDFSKILDAEIWMMAYGQVFFSSAWPPG